MCYNRTHVVSCEIVNRLTRTPIVGAYLPTLTLEDLSDLEEAMQRFRDPIFLGDLNVDLEKYRSMQSQQMSDLLAEYGIIDLVRHFWQRRRFWDLKTWSQVKQGTFLWSRCDYIIGTDQHRFELVGIQDMRNFSSDHFAFREQLLQRPTCCNSRYLQGRIAFPLRPPPPTTELIRVDAKFQTLKNLEPVPHQTENPPFPTMYVPRLHPVNW